MAMENIHNLNGCINRVFMRSKPFSDELYLKGDKKMQVGTTKGSVGAKDILDLIDKCIDLALVNRDSVHRIHVQQSKPVGGEGKASDNKSVIFSELTKEKLYLLHEILNSTQQSLNEFI